jgi:hypothetical protein
MSDADQLHELGQKLADTLTSSYGVASPGTHLVFLPGGVSVPADIVQSGLINPAQMQTWLAMNFDCPFIMSSADCSVHQKDASHGAASRIYTIAATTARPVGNPQDDNWKRVGGEIAAAQRSLGPPDDQKAIACAPDDWILPANAGYWNKFDSTQTITASAPAPSPQNWLPPRPTVNPQFWMVRSLAAKTMNADPTVVQAGGSAINEIRHREIYTRIAPAEAAAIPSPIFARRDLSASMSRADAPSFVEHAARASASNVEMLATETSIAPEILAENPAVAARSKLTSWSLAANNGVLSEINQRALFDTAEPVVNLTTTASSTIKVHLEHQCVTLGYLIAGQPWWDGVFLADTGWFIPGMARGNLLPAPSEGANGLVYGLPVAIVIVRNLRVSGQWTAEAATALGSKGGTLGPLSLFGAAPSVEADGAVTYAHEGMQVVALLCSAIPILPPVDSPGP